MQLLTMYPTSINPRHIDIAVKALRDGEIIIYPTDTLYALGCDALNNRAIERLCKFKGINPEKTRLAIVCSGISQASEYVRIDNVAFRILKDNLPGPFTFLLPAAPTLPKVFKSRKVVGLRIPENPIAVSLAEALGNPLLSTSTIFDPDEPNDALDASLVAHNYSDIASICIDGGTGNAGESTVVDLTDSTDPQIVRQGLGQLIC